MHPGRFVAYSALVALLAGAVPPAAAQPPAPRDEAPSADAAPSGQSVNLASQSADRWIVQLSEAPLARYAGGVTGLAPTANSTTGQDRLDTETPSSRAYLSHLDQGHNAFEARLGQAVPGAKVEQRYHTVLNGLAVKMSTSDAGAVRKLPGVRAVTPDIPYHLDMYATPAQIGAPALWDRVGGQGHAGEGVKVAIVDGGIYVTHDASGKYTGNACFDDSGYPRPPRGYPKGDTRFTNNKVLVARAYFRPDDPPTAGNDTALPGPDSTPHGTHVAGTVACNANTPVTFGGAQVTISGVAPRAYLMNYRVFYPSTSTDAFVNGNAFVSELVHAIDDAVNDGADIISNSWGSSYQNTLAWPDPMVQAAEAAVDAGVVMVFANGNAGPDNGTAIAPAISPKVIAVGAVTKNATISPGKIDVTGPAPVPANLVGLDVTAASFGPKVTTPTTPAHVIPAERVATNGSALGCSLTGDVSPFPAGSLSGSLALISRGTCDFSEKVFNAQRGGAVGALIYNSAAGGDNLQAMGPGHHAADVTIPSWFMRRSDGLSVRTFANAHPADAQARFTYAPHPAANVGDVMAGFSSRGPSTDKLIRPDVVAPGVDVLSSGFGSGPYPGPFVGFGSVSGTSMATPHVAGSAALLKQLHPRWKPADIKSALMSTATENVFLNTTRTLPAGVLDRGAGRIDLTRAGSPGLLLDHPSLSGGEIVAGQKLSFVVSARNVEDTDSSWTLSTALTGAASTNIAVSTSAPTLSIGGGESKRFTVKINALPNAAADSYEGDLVLTNAASGTKLHVPLWLRVVPTKIVADVLLVDDDGSGVGFADYAASYKATLQSLGVSFDYIDIDAQAFPSLNTLFGYRTVLIFTGDNDSFNSSGFFVSDLDVLMEWLDSGGKVWVTGQNIGDVYNTSGGGPTEHLNRGRFYDGYLGLAFQAESVYPGAAPRPTADGQGAAAGLRIDLSPGGGGAGNQASIDAETAIPDNDTFAAAPSTRPFFHQIGGTAPTASAIAFSRGSEPSLEEGRVQFKYRSLAFGFGLEGVDNNTGFATRQTVARRALDYLLDSISLKLNPPSSRGEQSTWTVQAVSSVGAKFSTFRWDFGDRSPIVTTTTPTVVHRQRDDNGGQAVRVEATDSLGHRAIVTGAGNNSNEDN